MRRFAALAVAFLLASGCLGDRPEDGDDAVPSPTPAAFETAYFLTESYGLSEEPPDRASTVGIKSGANTYAAYDLSEFHSGLLEDHRAVLNASLDLYFEVTEPVAVPFPDGSDPSSARVFAVWIGSGFSFSAYAQGYHDPGFVPNVVYHTTIEFALMEPGVLVRSGADLKILVTTTATNRDDVLRLRVGPGPDASRLMVDGATLPGRYVDIHTQTVLDQEATIQGNSGLSTGATAGDLSEYRTTFDLSATAHYVRIDLLSANAPPEPKSDLDLFLLDASGMEVASSTTAYQSETIELFPEHLTRLAPGPYTMLVNAYSGVDTDIRLIVGVNDPGPAPASLG